MHPLDTLHEAVVRRLERLYAGFNADKRVTSSMSAPTGIRDLPNHLRVRSLDDIHTRLTSQPRAKGINSLDHALLRVQQYTVHDFVAGRERSFLLLSDLLHLDGCSCGRLGRLGPAFW